MLSITFTVPPATIENWPLYGKVEFRDVSLKYAEKLPMVVHDFTVHIPGGTKVRCLA